MPTTKESALKKYLHWLNEDPREVREHDGGLYVPIHIVQADLLTGYKGLTKFEIKETAFGHGQRCFGTGRLHYYDYVSKEWLFQDGMALVNLTGNIRLDYPALGSHIFLNAAKKIGIRFGQNLNRDIEFGLVLNDFMPTVDKRTIPDAEMLATFKTKDPHTQELLRKIYIIPDAEEK